MFCTGLKKYQDGWISLLDYYEKSSWTFKTDFSKTLYTVSRGQITNEREGPLGFGKKACVEA